MCSHLERFHTQAIEYDNMLLVVEGFGIVVVTNCTHSDNS